MTVATRIPLGAPGLYELPDEPIRRLTAERMDVCAFVGVAPRGPARVPTFFAEWAPAPAIEGASEVQSVPVAVESWGAYHRIFGGFEGPGLLPYAVAAFFENGGRRAYVVRVVRADDGGSQGVAESSFPGLGATLDDGTVLGDLRLRARDEGTWGNGLTLRLDFESRRVTFEVDAARPTAIRIDRPERVDAGTVLRITDGGGAKVIRCVLRVTTSLRAGTGSRRASPDRWAELDAALPSDVARVEVVEGTLEIGDGEGREERWSGLGLASAHPRWLAAVLVLESELVYPWPGPDSAWYDQAILRVPEDLSGFSSAPFVGGANAYAGIAAGDFFGDWILGDEDPGHGVHALAGLEDLSSIVVPDLYSPTPLGAAESVVGTGAASGSFETCRPIVLPDQALPVHDLQGLALDPIQHLDEIVELQLRVVDFATDVGAVALLDVPPGLSQRRILEWRSNFASMWAAAYHPWLAVARPDDRRDALIPVNPSAFGAGIIARQEAAFGVAHGPANALAAGAVSVLDPVDDARHDALHPAAINVYRVERDGIRLTAARTLASTRDYRQLSVRRLVSLLCRTLMRQMQWAVFEPHDRRLRRDLEQMIRALLLELFRAGAFAGSRPDEAFFVRADDELNPPASMDAGRLIVHIGVAPAEPLEFILLQLVRGGDGTMRVEESR